MPPFFNQTRKINGLYIESKTNSPAELRLIVEPSENQTDEKTRVWKISVIEKQLEGDLTYE